MHTREVSLIQKALSVNDLASCLPTVIKELIYLGNEFDVGDFDGEYRLVPAKEYFVELD